MHGLSVAVAHRIPSWRCLLLHHGPSMWASVVVRQQIVAPQHGISQIRDQTLCPLNWEMIHNQIMTTRNIYKTLLWITFFDNFLQTKLIPFQPQQPLKGSYINLHTSRSDFFRLPLFSFKLWLFLYSLIHTITLISDFLCLYKVIILIFFPLASILTVNYSSSLYVKERKHWSTNECCQSI